MSLSKALRGVNKNKMNELLGGGSWHEPANSPRGKAQASFEAEAQAFVDWVKQSPAGQGFDAVQIAGDPERRARIQRGKDGIVIDDQTWADIMAAGVKVGINAL